MALHILIPFGLGLLDDLTKELLRYCEYGARVLLLYRVVLFGRATAVEASGRFHVGRRQ